MIFQESYMTIQEFYMTIQVSLRFFMISQETYMIWDNLVREGPMNCSSQSGGPVCLHPATWLTERHVSTLRISTN